MAISPNTHGQDSQRTERCYRGDGTLERSLAIRLLSSSTHIMRLTGDGERCYESAKELLANWAAFDSDLRGVDDEPEGILLASLRE